MPRPKLRWNGCWPARRLATKRKPNCEPCAKKLNPFALRREVDRALKEINEQRELKA